MKKENWNISYAKLASEHKWGGVINTFLALMGFCYLVNWFSSSAFDNFLVMGAIENQAIIIALITFVHTLALPKILKLN